MSPERMSPTPGKWDGRVGTVLGRTETSHSGRWPLNQETVGTLRDSYKQIPGHRIVCVDLAILQLLELSGMIILIGSRTTRLTV